MKKFKRIVRGLVKFYKSINNDYIPIYCGDEVVDYARVGSIL